MAGVTPHDAEAAAAGLPAPDSLNLWPYLSGNVSASPRTSIHLSDVAFVSGQYKLIRTNQPLRGCWSGPLYPNASQNTLPSFGPWLSPCPPSRDCAGDGCLFDVVRDPHERVNLARSHASLLSRMQQQLEEANRHRFTPQRGGFDARACDAAERAGGFWGPFIGV